MSPEKESPGDNIPQVKNPHHVSRETLSRIQKYVDLVFRWQGSVNLTGAKSPQEFFPHIWDCLGAREILPPFPRWVDVGTGAGLPGILWALTHPQEEFLLVEKQQKRASFLMRVVGELSLSNVRVWKGAFQDLRAGDAFGREVVRIVSRGTSSPQSLIKMMELAQIPFSHWYVFASKATAQEFLTLQNNSARQTSLLGYPRQAGLKSSGILVECRHR